MGESMIKGYLAFKDIKVLVDGGGGNGTVLAKIVVAHPHLHGINSKLPGIVAQAPQIPVPALICVNNRLLKNINR